MKKLGFGCMRLPLTDANDPTSIDKEQVCEMFDTFLDNGFEYVDTAWPYHSQMSEPTVKECLVDRHDRNEFRLATKLPTFALKEKEDCKKFFNAQLEKTGAGYFDYYLIHCLNEQNYKTAKECEAFEFVSKMKDEGKIKEMGFSFHDTPELLDQILTDHPEVDFVQLQINYLDWDAENVQSRACYETARKHGKEIVVMEPVKGGKLVDVPQNVKETLHSLDPEKSAASFAIRFAAGLPGVRMVLSGMSDLDQMNDNISYMKDFQPLSEEEQEIILDCGRRIRESVTVPCTACSYCTDGCPQHICIPDYFQLWNERNQQLSKGKSAAYDKLAETHGHASDCIECGQCESMCPQHISIIEELKKVAQSFE